MPTTQQVRSFFEEEGCTLLEDYTHWSLKMKWLCPLGHENSTTWNNFSNGRRCPKCSKVYKRSLKEVCQLFASRGCEFLDNEFKGVHHSHRYRCKCGREATVSLAAFESQQQHCKECGLEKVRAYAKSRRKTQEEVAAYFDSQGCVLTGEYINNSTPLTYFCSCGRETSTSWANFRKGKRCGYCISRCKPYTLEELQILFRDHGCELLETETKPYETPLRYRCKCGRESAIRLNNLISQKSYCIGCRSDSMQGENHHNWFADREEFAARKKFKKRAYQLLRRTRLKTNTVKVSKTEEMLGYTHDELRSHIENHPNWPAVMDKDWHLDHIFPIQAFLDRGIKNVALINCLENLQPLLGKNNNEKKDKYDEAAFEAWLASRSGI